MDMKLLSSLGLNKNEMRVYQAVLRTGRVTPAELAKASGIKRTTTYSIARGLVDKGFLIESAEKRPRVFMPATPQDIEGLVVEEHKRLAERERNLKKLSGELSRAKIDLSYPVPNVRFVESEKIERFLYTETPIWNHSMAEVAPTWWGFQDRTFTEEFQKWINWQWTHSPKDIDLKLLTNTSEREKKIAGKYAKRHVKFWDKATGFDSSTWVCGDYVVMVQTRTHPHYLVEIHAPALAHDQREIFRNLWPLV